MPTREFPFPDKVLLGLPPEDLAAAALAGIRQVYGVELDYRIESLLRLDVLIRERFRLGKYTRETFPGMLALGISAYLGELLPRTVPGGHWGEQQEDLYGTPLPFLVFSRPDHEQQVNVAEDLMTFLWTGRGLSPRNYFNHQVAMLGRMGFITER